MATLEVVMDENSCAHCKHFVVNLNVAHVSKECRRFPPVWADGFKFPQVDHRDFCGEFEKREQQ